MSTVVHFPEQPFDLAFPLEGPTAVRDLLARLIRDRYVLSISDEQLSGADGEGGSITLVNFGAITHLSITGLSGPPRPMPGRVLVQCFADGDGLSLLATPGGS